MMTDNRELDKTRPRQRLAHEIMNTEHQSTYRLLIRSEEKGRGILETILYGLMALSVMPSIVQFGCEHNRLPSALMGEPQEMQYLSHEPDLDCDGQC